MVHSHPPLVHSCRFQNITVIVSGAEDGRVGSLIRLDNKEGLIMRRPGRRRSDMIKVTLICLDGMQMAIAQAVMRHGMGQN
jgi:hypothetical protein